MFAYHFMVNALEAGTAVAIAAAAIGWFMVLRRQTFAGHTLALISFPGSAAAALIGIPLAFGYFGACAAGAVVLAGSSVDRRTSDSALTGTVQAFALALGFLFVSLYHGLLSGTESLLFGTFLGISDNQVLALGAVAVLSLLALATAGRPLLFASVDLDVARAAGVPVRALSLGFLLLLGLAVAATSQITGALLVFALLVAPPAAAQRITARPLPGLVLSAAIGVAVTWGGLTLAYYSVYPAGFYITTLAFAAFIAATIVQKARA